MKNINGIYKAPKGLWYDWTVIYESSKSMLNGSRKEAEKELKDLEKEGANAGLDGSTIKTNLISNGWNVTTD